MFCCGLQQGQQPIVPRRITQVKIIRHPAPLGTVAVVAQHDVVVAPKARAQNSISFTRSLSRRLVAHKAVQTLRAPPLFGTQKVVAQRDMHVPPSVSLGRVLVYSPNRRLLQGGRLVVRTFRLLPSFECERVVAQRDIVLSPNVRPPCLVSFYPPFIRPVLEVLAYLAFASSLYEFAFIFLVPLCFVVVYSRDNNRSYPAASPR